GVDWTGNGWGEAGAEVARNATANEALPTTGRFRVEAAPLFPKPRRYLSGPRASGEPGLATHKPSRQEGRGPPADAPKRLAPSMEVADSHSPCPPPRAPARWGHAGPIFTAII